jgi:hypothetical protein
MFAEALTLDTHSLPSVRENNSTEHGRMNTHQDREEIEHDWGARAVHWLRARYVNWPMKAIARDLDEPDGVIISWWKGGRPSRQKLQKLTRRFAREGFSSFVFGEPCREELRARLDALNNNVKELREMLNATERLAGPRMRVAGGRA